MKAASGSRGLVWLPPVTIALLMVATLAAFVWSQRLKREPLVIDRVEYIALGVSPDGHAPTVFTPNGDCRRDRMTINFRTTRTDIADVEIIGRFGNVIRTLARDRFFKRYREHTMIWDGRKDNGEVPMTGKYRVRVTMHGEDRVLYLPGWIRLHRHPAAGPSACPTPDGGQAAGRATGRDALPDGPSSPERESR